MNQEQQARTPALPGQALVRSNQVVGRAPEARSIFPMWRIEFSSEKFAPYLPEEAQQNPGAYGFELAHWLSLQLVNRGIVTSYPLGEDWGWFIEYLDGETEIMIGCYSEASEGDGYTRKPIAWRVFVEQSRSLGQRLKGTQPSPKIEELVQAITSLLEAEDISVKPTED